MRTCVLKFSWTGSGILKEEKTRWICERHLICESKSCLEKEQHDKNPWCNQYSKCDETGLKVRCHEIK